MNNEILFKERQYCRMWWVWVLVLGICGLFIGISVATWQTGWVSITVMDGFILAILLLTLTWHLDTEIREDGIYVKVFPFHRSWKYYAWDEIRTAYVRKYKPTAEYGGWGIKGFSKNNMAYNVNGNMGMQLEFKNGNKLLIGTGKPEQVERILRKCSVSEKTSSMFAGDDGGKIL